MKYIIPFLTLLVFPWQAFSVTNEQGEELSVRVESTASNAAILEIVAKDIVRRTQPLERVTPEIEYTGPSGTVRGATEALSCQGARCSKTIRTTLSPLTCNATYRGTVRIRTANPSSASVFLTESFGFQTRPCVGQLATTIENVNSTESSVSATVVITIPPETPIAGRTNFTLSLTATTQGSAPITKEVIVSETASARIAETIELSGLTCETPYTLTATSKTGTQNNIPSQSRDITTERCGSSGGGGGTGGSPTDNTYEFLTPLPLAEGLNPQESIVIGETGEGGVFGILQRIITLLLITAVVLAVVYLIIGGARYATGDTLGSVDGGRKIITNAIVGLLFALLSWLLLNIINPDLTRFTLEVPNIAGKLTVVGGNQAGTSGGVDNGGTAGECADCVPLTGIQTNAQTCCREFQRDNCPASEILSGEQCKVNRELHQKLRTLSGALEEGVLTVTEAWPPTISSHANNCHATGKCVDARSNQSGEVKTEAQLLDFIQAAQEASLLVQYEVPNIADATRLSNAVPQELRRSCPRERCVIQLQNVRPHFSVYLKSNSGSSGGGSQSGCGRIQNKDSYVFEHLNIAGGVKNGVVYCPTEASRKLQTTNSIKPVLRTVASQESIDYKLFRALISQESEGRFDAGPSPKGAYGIGQMLISTARDVDSTFQRKFVGKDDAFVISWLKSSEVEKYTYSLRLSARYIKRFSNNSLNDQIASYNAGPGGLGSSLNCPGRKKWECPWESGTQAAGNLCYDRANPTVPKRTDCDWNANRREGSFEETRFYVTNIREMMEQITD